LNMYKHIYYYGETFLCSEYVNDDLDYKIKLEMEALFYQDEDGDWHADWGNFDMRRKLRLKLKMWKMVGTDIYYKSSDTLDDISFEIGE
jgi:hypothetical protein